MSTDTTEEQELVARALCKIMGNDPERWTQYRFFAACVIASSETMESLREAGYLKEKGDE